MTVYDAIKNQLSENVYPFASDPAGNFICFLLIENEIKGIYYWKHEEEFDIENRKIRNINNGIFSNMEFLSPSLKIFLENLYSPE
ncbi:hypothetical protein FHQ30_13010 [Pasteurellaceae bacterium Phil11]|nr:hypothetical protein FHQ30_13010 [Pasteurellaceae bacterium Phil11]